MAERLLRAFVFMATKQRPNQDQIKRQVVDFEVKSTAEGEGDIAGTFSGYAAGIHNIDSVGDMILPGAFDDDLPRFLKEGAICWNHDWRTPIGSPTSAKEDDYGLFVEGTVVSTTAGSDIMKLLRTKVVKKMSIGYRVQDYEWMDRAGLVSYLNANCRSKAGAILQQHDEMGLTELFLIKKLKLYEFSPVTFPANNNANITSAKGDLLTGLTFADHSKAVLTAVSEYATRAASIAALKQEQNRKTIFSDERKADISEVIQNLSQSLESLKSVLDTPRANAEAALLFAQYQKLEARLNGCAV